MLNPISRHRGSPDKASFYGKPGGIEIVNQFDCRHVFRDGKISYWHWNWAFHGESGLICFNTAEQAWNGFVNNLITNHIYGGSERKSLTGSKELARIYLPELKGGK